MEIINATFLSYGANLFTVFALYPYRDFVKHVDKRMLSEHNVYWAEYILSRYRGMIQNPSQPLLLATPIALLYGGYVSVGGSYGGAFVGSLFFAAAKVAVATIAVRMSNCNETFYKRSESYFYLTNTSLIKRWIYRNNFMRCIIDSARYYGILSFFTGVTATLLIAFCWHGLTLYQLHQLFYRRRHDVSFSSSFFDALKIHGLLALLTCPIRNSFRSSLSRIERAGGVHSVSEFYVAEKASFIEAFGVAKREMQLFNIRFFIRNSLRTIFKTSLPFALTYALYTTFGGILSSQNDYKRRNSNKNNNDDDDDNTTKKNAIGRHHTHYFSHRYH